MKVEKLRMGLERNRPMTSVTIRMPEDVVEDLEQLAPTLGFSGYQPLIRAYVGQGMRHDMKRLEKDRMAVLIDSLRRNGVTDEVISRALEEAGGE
ncbi:MAG: hypothetical protein KF911_12115 [Pseudomonadales bacterium]|nr:hypothetical protein [Pseudomonadales bacterium]